MTDTPTIYVLTGLLITVTSRISALRTQDAQHNIIRHLDTVNHHLTALSRSIRSAHSDITSRSLEECRFMGPMSDTICSILHDDSLRSQDEDISDILNNANSADKRSGRDTEDISRRQELLQDLIQKQTVLEKLKSIVDGAQDSVKQERKRSCNLNLGFHCQAEQYSAIADMYNWLQSSLSPGRRRRRDTTKLRSIFTKSQ